MSSEYSKRYSSEWLYFHNPVKMSRKFNDKHPFQNKSKKFCYFGSINYVNVDVIEEFIKCISTKYNFEFHIFSNDTAKESHNTFYHSFTALEDLKVRLNEFDYLILPITFNPKFRDFVKFSIPTKFSDYLSSFIPVILISPADIALYNVVSERKLCFTISDISALSKSIEEIVNSTDQDRLLITERAYNYCYEYCSFDKVLPKFNIIFN
jgi:hypothetical protein